MRGKLWYREGFPRVGRRVFSSVSFFVLDCLRLSVLGSFIVLENSLPTLNQLDAKPTPLVTCSLFPTLGVLSPSWVCNSSKSGIFLNGEYKTTLSSLILWDALWNWIFCVLFWSWINSSQTSATLLRHTRLRNLPFARCCCCCFFPLAAFSLNLICRLSLNPRNSRSRRPYEAKWTNGRSPPDSLFMLVSLRKEWERVKNSLAFNSKVVF